MGDNYTYKLESKSETEFEIHVQVTPDYFKQEKEKVFKKLAVNVEIKGFRPGKAPKNLIEAKLGAKVYEETINSIFPKIASEIVKKEEINPVTQLEYHLEKVSDDDGLQFHFHFQGIGKVVVPDVRKLKTKKDKVEIKKDEIEAVLKDMLDRENEKGKEKVKKTDKSKKSAVKADDEWVKSLKIEGITNLQELRGKIKEQLEIQKKQMAEEKYVSNLVDEMVAKAEIKVPEGLIQREMENQEKMYRKRIEDLGLEFDVFLKTKKIDLDELKKNWREEANKKIGREILLVEIAKTQEFKIGPEEIDKELAIIQDQNIKQQYSTEAGRNFIATVLIQQKAVNWIKEEKQGPKAKAK